MRHERARRSAAKARARHLVHEMGRTGLAKGRDPERRVGEALLLLKKWGCVASCGLSEHNDALDKTGVDAFFTTLDGTEVKFQIKSNQRGVLRHMQRHPDIPCVNLEGYTFVADIAVFLLRKFGLPLRPPDADDDTDDDA